MAVSPDTLSNLLKLPEDERVEIAHRLLISLVPTEIDPQLRGEWAREIEARLGAYDRGDAVAHEWRPALQQIRQRLQNRTS